MNKNPYQINFHKSKTQTSVYNKTILDNGIRIVSENIPYVHSVAFGIWINVGSRDESVKNLGISHFLEHMVFKGTKKYSALQIAKNIEGYGGYINGFTGKESTCYYVKILDEQLNRAFDVLSELVINPVFKEKDIKKEKFVILEELKNIEDDPEDFIFEYFEKKLYGSHPLGYPVIGEIESINNTTIEKLTNFINTKYQSDQIVIAAAGNIKHDHLVNLVTEKFSVFPKPQKNVKNRKAPSIKLKSNLYREEKPIQQAHICLGTKTPGISSKFRYPTVLMNTILGEGMSSRLFQNIREKFGFSYSIGSFLNLLSDSGNFGIYTGTNKNNIQNSIELINKELLKLKSQPVNNAELNRTKAQVKGSIMLGLESMSNRMMRLGSGEIYFNQYIPLENIVEKIDKVTSDDILETASDIIDENKFVTVIFSPAD